MNKIIMMFFLSLSFSNLYSNCSDTIVIKNKLFRGITDTTYDCTVVTSSRNTYKDVNLFSLTDSAVMILKDDVSKKLFISNIRTIKFKGRGFGTGGLVGGSIGFIMGVIIGSGGINLGSDGGHDGTVGEAVGAGALLAIPFFFLGGGIGALFAEDQFYDLSKMDFETKRYKIKNLIRENSDK